MPKYLKKIQDTIWEEKNDSNEMEIYEAFDSQR